MADKYEIKKVWVPTGFREGDPSDDYAWTSAKSEAEAGWELIGAVPIISSKVFPTGHMGSPYSELTFPYTSGYILLFKRRVEKNSPPDIKPLANKP